MRILIITSLLFLASCAHSVKKETRVQVVKDNNLKKVELPITTVDFNDPASYVGTEQVYQCQDEFLFFLVKQPFFGLNKLKDFYDDTLILNQDMQKLIEISIQTRKGLMSIEDYVQESSEINLEMNEINNSVESKLKEYVSIQYKTQAYYPVCEDNLKTMLTAKRVDTNQDGCELEQQQAYILDPYAFKNATNEAIRIELQIHDYLTKLYRIVFSEIHQKISLEEAQAQFLQTAEELKASGLQDKSVEAMDRVVNTYKSTMYVKEQCAASKKTPSKK